MGGYFLVAVLAAFGTFSALWAMFGFLLPTVRRGWLVCPGYGDCLTFAYVYLWLRGMGLVCCPLVVADLGLSDEERTFLGEKDIEVCPPEELLHRLELGAEEH